MFLPSEEVEANGAELISEKPEVRLGGLECPRCHQAFTVSYWIGSDLIQARCMSCDLKWPLPSVV
jgi:hypothetical protein